MTECPADVLVVDSSVNERNHAAKTSGKSSWTEMPAEELHQLVRGHWCELLDANFVGMHDSTFCETLNQAEGGQLFVADHMCNDVLHRPAVAQARRVPLLRCQRFKE